MVILCECNSFTCSSKIDAPFEDLKEAKKDNQVVISTSCIHGPDPTDELIEVRNGYKIYKTNS